jgi:hypothetical protein
MKKETQEREWAEVGKKKQDSETGEITRERNLRIKQVVRTRKTKGYKNDER